MMCFGIAEIFIAIDGDDMTMIKSYRGSVLFSSCHLERPYGRRDLKVFSLSGDRKQGTGDRKRQDFSHSFEMTGMRGEMTRMRLFEVSEYPKGHKHPKGYETPNDSTG